MKSDNIPFALTLNFVTGDLEPNNDEIQRHLSDMRNMYYDRQATEDILKVEDPLLYKVYQWLVPPEVGQLVVCTTVIYPGKVGNEYYMTKGHIHAKTDRSEVYIGLEGKGALLLSKDDQFEMIEFYKGAVAYVPPHWAHRTVNTGEENLVFLGIYPADAGHNYEEIERFGFSHLVVEQEKRPVVIPNPKIRDV